MNPSVTNTNSLTTQKEENFVVIRIVGKEKYVRISGLDLSRSPPNIRLHFSIVSKPNAADLTKHLEKYPNLLTDIIPVLQDTIQQLLKKYRASELDKINNINDLKNNINLINSVNDVDELSKFPGMNVQYYSRMYDMQIIKPYARVDASSVSKLDYLKNSLIREYEYQIDSYKRNIKYDHTDSRKFKTMSTSKFELVRIKKITDTVITTQELVI